MLPEPSIPPPSEPARRGPLRRLIRNWRKRHRDPFNFWIHMIGIPLALVGVVLFFTGPWHWAAVAFVVGYFLQYLGHRVEGNDVGEWAAIKRLLGWPYVGISPRWEQANPETTRQEER